MAGLPSGSSPRILIPPSALGTGGCKMQAFSGAVPKQGDKFRESRGCEHGWNREGSPSAPTPRQAVHPAESWAGRWGGLGPGRKHFSAFPFFFFSIKVWLINNTVLVSGIQHSDSIFLQIILHLKLLFSAQSCPALCVAMNLQHTSFSVLHHLHLKLLQIDGYISLCCTLYP